MRLHAVLLAAGRGARLRPLTDTRPKCLLEAAGTPLLTRMVDMLLARDVARITVVDGYRGGMIRAALGERFPGAAFRFVRNADWESTNNAYSLHLARFPEAGPMLLLDTDLLFQPEVLDRMMEDPHPNRIALRTRGGWGEEEMKVRLTGDGLVAGLGKDIPPDEAAGESLDIEVFSAAFTRKLFTALDRRVASGEGRHEFYEAAFGEVIGAGEPVHAVDLGGLACMEIDTAEDLALAERAFGTAR